MKRSQNIPEKPIGLRVIHTKENSSTQKNIKFMTTVSDQTRLEALKILKGLSQKLYSLTADIFYEALDEEGFSDNEKVHLVGACIRTASSRGWITRTDYSVKSCRNSSNLQSVWKSKIYKQRNGGGKLDDNEIQAEYQHWHKKGHLIPDHLAAAWE